ncbi:carbamoylphosphate synthase large subunit [Candidatus Villigracilis affinis]|uniref:carbamoylphosphate synthase large subunit n=1 Tax=Candidatus Villigracilis affinis TaxID=3140682 RepID=UPI001D4C00C8|nr:carbamoylphosphate synthase large subunit [Anaerolineales bacterium]
MANILLTGGRAPVTLDLARVFRRAGHTVFMAESLRGHLSQPSNAIKANFLVPAPRQEKEAFLIALKKIVAENQIDLLIPTCEEIFHMAMAHDELPLFAEPIKKLKQFHNKWEFVVHAVDNDLHVPETILVQNQEDLLHAYAQWRGLVLKPVYSRFASRTLILPTLQKASSSLTFSARQPWVAQQYIEGQAFCTYSVCHNGRITAHTTYPSRFTAGRGATIVFRHVEHSAIFNWVKSFVGQNKFTGQIAFDFIQTPDGQLFALECNPRATSGVHLLASHPRFAESFSNPFMDCITPTGDRSYMLSAAMLLYGLPAALRHGGFRDWVKTYFSSDDVILDFKDPLPAVMQLRSVLATRAIAKRENISLLEASTFDIEWNGEG